MFTNYWAKTDVYTSQHKDPFRTPAVLNPNHTLIADLRGRGVSVHGLTSRGSSSSHFPFAWHNAQVAEARAERALGPV